MGWSVGGGGVGVVLWGAVRGVDELAGGGGGRGAGLGE